MGLLNEINNVNRTLQDNQQRQLTKSEQKELEKIKKQHLARILNNEMRLLFEETQSNKEVEELTSELLVHRRSNILEVKKIYEKRYKKNLIQNDIDYLNDIYFKTIKIFNKEFMIIYKKDVEEERQAERQRKEKEKQAERQRKEEEKQQVIAERTAQKEYIQKQKEKQIAFNNTMQALKTITLILLSPFILIGFILMGIMKNMK